MQKAVTQFVSQCSRAKIFVENEMPIGVFHDFLMEMKGLMVERMVAAHKEQMEVTEAQKAESCIDEQGCSPKEE